MDSRDRYFTLAEFDRLSMEHAFTRVCVRSEQLPHLYNHFDKVELNDLDNALKRKELRRRGRTNSMAVISEDTKKADALLKQVEISSVNVWGSNEERKRCRNEAFGMVGKFGQPSLFVTLTPNTDNGMSIAYYSGITGFNSLLDLEFKNMPNKIDVESISMKDYCASARLYDRIISTFLTTALGWDSKFKCSLKEGGLFGHVHAYYGMTETQGGATLHCHLLIWLHGAPKTTLQYEAQSEKEKEIFKSQFEAYA